MKNILRLLFLTFVLISLSCKKNIKDYPSINFIGGPNLISQNSVLEPNENFGVGINSFSKSESMLYKFKVTRVYNNNPVIVSDSIINSNNFNTILTCPTPRNESIERWIFSISCSDGYSSEISFLIRSSYDTVSNFRPDDSYMKQYILPDLPNNLDENLPIYIGSFVILILVIILYFILKSKKTKDIKIENFDDFKNDIMTKMDDQNKKISHLTNLIIDRKINDYQNQIDDLKNKFNKEPSKKINNYIIAAASIIIMLIILFLYSFYFQNKLNAKIIPIKSISNTTKEKIENKQLSSDSLISLRPDTLTYRIQICILDRFIPLNSFSNFKDVEFYEKDGKYNYTVGNFNTLKEANSYLNIVNRTFNDAFVLVFKNGRRLDEPQNKFLSE